MAVIILLTFISLDQWKKQTFRPPVFEAEKPVVEGKTDSVQELAKDESAFRTAETEKDKKVGLVEEKRLDQPAPERGAATLSQKSAENVPAASAPLGRALAVPKEQKTNEELSLAAFAERDEAIKGDTVLATAGKKAETRKEVATSQVKVPAEEIEKLQTRRGVLAPHLGIRAQVPSDTLKVKEDTALKFRPPDTGIQEYSLIKGGFDAQYGGKIMPSSDTAQTIANLQKVIERNEGLLRMMEFNIDKRRIYERENKKPSPGTKSDTTLRSIDEIAPSKPSQQVFDSLCILVGNNYLQLYRLSLADEDWEKASQYLNWKIKYGRKLYSLSDSTRQRLLQIQAELKKLKK
ncbi:MAG: hypothetical protein L0Z48_10555 [candidate division Zixibacteria bacterium]|nr:hypothetical protein [candidate division Zixibacteria bacterium]